MTKMLKKVSMNVPASEGRVHVSSGSLMKLYEVAEVGDKVNDGRG